MVDSTTPCSRAWGLSNPGVIAAYLLGADRAAVVALPRLADVHGAMSPSAYDKNTSSAPIDTAALSWT